MVNEKKTTTLHIEMPGDVDTGQVSPAEKTTPYKKAAVKMKPVGNEVNSLSWPRADNIFMGK